MGSREMIPIPGTSLYICARGIAGLDWLPALYTDYLHLSNSWSMLGALCEFALFINTHMCNM